MLPLLTLPKPVPMQRTRLPQETIPATSAEREWLKDAIRSYVAECGNAITPPLMKEELRRHAEIIVQRTGINPLYRDFAGVLLNNEAWREQLAAIPYERRLLLLPKCLRVEDRCPAPFDEFGLLCKQCGLCTIQDLQEEAERLGYPVLVAEGSALVMALIQTGKIDAIVGVSCLSVLEKAFPYMEAAAIPGIAVPLLQDDCKDTTVDIDWVWDFIHLTSDDHTRRMDLDALRKEVETWFTSEALDGIFGESAAGSAEIVAREWLARAGKRWRPFLTVCAWRALQDDPNAPVPEALKKVAVAVECFHKASLVHDDIEDNDAERYGEPALHTAHGVAIALNAGDLLIGEGYRLLAGSASPAVPEMIRIAAEGHRQLCIGQGAELSWQRGRQPLTALEVLDIFRRKTAPAFEVALRLGAAFSGADAEVHDVLRQYSESLGIAYQIRDDLEDLESQSDLLAARPSLPLALAYERARERKPVIEQLWRGAANIDEARQVINDTDAPGRCRQLLEAQKEQAVRSLPQLRNASLKGLLRRVIGKIFTLEVQGWCSEFETRNAASRETRAEAAR
ncbi:MAG TPA: polyprenyl synthetase family protein [Bryobacteraceae bacterium]|nr:polyprenyl synthetase family protein [Bryobacteraceae bacterium]